MSRKCSSAWAAGFLLAQLRPHNLGTIGTKLQQIILKFFAKNYYSKFKTKRVDTATRKEAT